MLLVPIAVIPNGVDSPSLSVSSSNNPPWSDVIPDGDHILLYLGRFTAKRVLILCYVLGSQFLQMLSCIVSGWSLWGMEMMVRFLRVLQRHIAVVSWKGSAYLVPFLVPKRQSLYLLLRPSFFPLF